MVLFYDLGFGGFVCIFVAVFGTYVILLWTTFSMVLFLIMNNRAELIYR